MNSGVVAGLHRMLIVAGHLIVDEEDRDRYVADCAAAVVAARQAHGCLDFAVSADLIDPRRVNIFERWSSRELLGAFRGSGPDDATRNRIREGNVSEYPIGSA